MDPDEALRAFAESVGMKGDIITQCVTKDDEGQIVEISWRSMYLDGTLPTVALNMPYLRVLDLYDNASLTGA